MVHCTSSPFFCSTRMGMYPREGAHQKRVILETDPKLQASLDSLSSIYIPTSTSSGNVPGQVPLTAVATVRESTAPLRIDHLGQFPSTAISFISPSAMP